MTDCFGEIAYAGDFSTQRGITKVFGPRQVCQNSGPVIDHAIGHVYYELWSNGVRVYNGASDDFRERLHSLIAECKIINVDKIVVCNYSDPKERDDREVNEQLKSLPPRNKRVQRNTHGQGYKNG